MKRATISTSSGQQRLDNAAGYLFISPWLFVFRSEVIPIIADHPFFYQLRSSLLPRAGWGCRISGRCSLRPKILESGKATLSALTAVPLPDRRSFGSHVLNTAGEARPVSRPFLCPLVVGDGRRAVMWRQYSARRPRQLVSAPFGFPGIRLWLDPQFAIWTLYFRPPGNSVRPC